MCCRKCFFLCGMVQCRGSVRDAGSGSCSGNHAIRYRGGKRWKRASTPARARVSPARLTLLPRSVFAEGRPRCCLERPTQSSTGTVSFRLSNATLEVHVTSFSLLRTRWPSIGSETACSPSSGQDHQPGLSNISLSTRHGREWGCGKYRPLTILQQMVKFQIAR